MHLRVWMSQPVSEFLISGIVYMIIFDSHFKHEYSVLYSIWPKSRPIDILKNSSMRYKIHITTHVNVSSM